MIRKSLRIFLTSFLLTFMMSVIPHLFIKQDWVSPVPKTAPDILEKLQPKLNSRPNHFQLKKQLIPFAAAGSDYEQASAYAVVDMDNGEILASKNLNQKLPMASLTKIMTAVVALDLAKPTDEFIVSETAARQQPSKVMLQAGERFSLENLLDSLLISSANDSAQVIKEGIDAKFGPDTFIKAMNLKAQILDLKNTHFTNPAGFDNKNHFSSVADLSMLATYALNQYPLISQIVSLEYKDLTQGGADNRFYLNNWNGLLGVYPGVSGVKIGNTANAGYSTIVSSERAGKKLITVLLGAPGVLERDLWTSELLDLGFSKSAGLPPADITEYDLKQKYASWKYY